MKKLPPLISGLWGLLAILLTSTPLLHAGEWTWHTFPGKLHIENGYPGSEQPYTGYDRSEWISAFGVSPVISEGHDAPFMMMSTDLGAVVYCADGERFQPANLPYSGGVAVGFDPHDGDTGYAVVHKIFEKTRCYLYRTRDRGATWERLTEASYFRVQRSMILVDPVPERAGHIYLATLTGIKRSLDDGATWSVIPETEGLRVRTMIFNADGSSLYFINGSVRDIDLETGDFNLYRLDFSGTDGSYTFQQIRTGDARDIRPHPVDPERAIVLNRQNRFIWSEDRGETNGLDITPFGITNPQHSLINPANPEHIIAFGEPRVTSSYYWTTDGGTTWNTFSTEVIDNRTFFTGVVDSAPFNHGNPFGYIPAEANDSRIEGDRFVVGFWPGKPDWVLTFGMTQKAKGPYISKNSGATFEPFGYGGLTKEHTMTAFGSTDDVMAVARIEYGLAHTTNGGLWWAGSSNFNDPLLDEIQDASATTGSAVWLKSTFHGIAIDPENDAHWIGFYGHNPGWIIRSSDYGATWEKVFEYTDFDIERLNFYWQARWVFWHQQDTDTIYVGPYKSTDRDQTWNRLPGDYAVTDMSTENGDVLLYRPVGTAATYYLSIDGGDNWNQLPIPPRDPVSFRRPERPDGRWPSLAAIDPDPLRDPTVPGQTARILIGSRNGAVEFNAGNQIGTEGTYTVHGEGIIIDDDPWLEDRPVYFSGVVFDPRPGKHHIAYMAPGLGWNNTQRSTIDKYHRQVYRSQDGGLSWSRIINDEDVASLSVADTFQVTGPLYVSPNTGKLYVHSWSGMFVYDHEAGGEDFWFGYPIRNGRNVDTGSWLNGQVDISTDPWIYLYSLDGYGYLPDDSGWIYLPK